VRHGPISLAGDTKQPGALLRGFSPLLELMVGRSDGCLPHGPIECLISSDGTQVWLTNGEPGTMSEFNVSTGPRSKPSPWRHYRLLSGNPASVTE
jgi:hypothetical protein